MADEAKKPARATWRPVRDLAPEMHGWSHRGAREAASRWRRIRTRLEDPEIDRSAMDIWLAEQKRAFAIETGQVESLYLLRRGVTETLIAEGFEGVRGSHSVTGIADDTLKGLLQDQEAALEMAFAQAREERPLTAHTLKEWHALLTRHQETATGFNPFTRLRTKIPLRKGEFKVRPNNPLRDDGFVHEHCPPEQVRSEVGRFLEFHVGHQGLDLAPEVEAAWLHHEFVRVHPFQDGNGRMSRLLMSLPYVKAGEFPPVIMTQAKQDYYTALELADGGNFRALVDYLGRLSEDRALSAIGRAELILTGRTHYRHANGGVTSNGIYRRPEPETHEILTDGPTR